MISNCNCDDMIARRRWANKRIAELEAENQRLREVLEEILADAESYEKRYATKIQGWPDKARALLAEHDAKALKGERGQ